MKKLITIIVLMCYLIPSFGFSVTAHYCGGKMRSIGMSISKRQNCCGTKKMKLGCCKDKICTIKLKDIHQGVASASITPYKMQYAPTLFFTYSTLVRATTIAYEFPAYYSLPPPLGKQQPLYLSNRAFRI
jgi:hypothetical protein